MFRRFTGMALLIGVSVLLLTGCFREANPEVIPPTVPSTPLPDEGASPSPFVTPFEPGIGPDITQMPTLSAPTATLSLAEPGGGDLGIVSPSPLPGTLLPQATSTVPFAAGATYTPVPGAPPINLNPETRSSPTPIPPAADTSSDSGEDVPLEGEPCIYVVQAGDTAFYIATMHGVTLPELIEANGLENADYLYEGQELRIPNCGDELFAPEGEQSGESGGGDSIIQTTAPTVRVTVTQSVLTQQPSPTRAPGEPVVHVVVSGENLFRIAMKYGVTVQDIVDANNLGSAEAILSVGQELIIPVP